MEKFGLNQLREMFLSFFETKGHLRLPSFSLIPQNDASLLLINSGMAPMKPFSSALNAGTRPGFPGRLRSGRRDEAQGLTPNDPSLQCPAPALFVTA